MLSRKNNLQKLQKEKMSPEYHKDGTSGNYLCNKEKFARMCLLSTTKCKKRCSLKQKQQVTGKKGTEQFIYLEEMDEIRNGSKKLKREKWNYNPHWRR